MPFAPGVDADAFAAAPAVFFDFDGTLANTVDSIRATARIALADFGLSEEEIGDVNRIIGPAFPGAFSEVYGMSEKDAAWVTAHYRELYRSCGPEACAPYPGIVGLLDALRAQGRTAAVVTCKLTSLASSGAEVHGYLDRFALVMGKADDTPTTKAQLVAAALKELGLSPSQAVMVGDRRNDMEGAAANGVLALGVAYGAGSAPELWEAGAQCVVDSVDGLSRVLLGR
ncbi:HAD hydrolase-like protein [Atopobiaceae bacterium 24-176]